MSAVKNIIKKVFGKYNIRRIMYGKTIYTKLAKSSENTYSLKDCIHNTKIIKGEKDKVNQIKKLFNEIDIGKVEKNENFYYNIDIFKVLYAANGVISNLTLDYTKILNQSLNDIKNNIEKNKNENQFYENEINTIEAISNLIDRIVNMLKEQNASKEIIKSIEGIKTQKATTLKDALQRVLFFNQILWQTGHTLNGLGRLDIMLEPYYYSEIDKKIITDEKLKELLKDFIVKLHNDYYFKSNSLLGDTGQVIELGGINKEGKYQCNKITYMFIELMEELQLPDPKVLLRTSKNMPRDLLARSLKCIQTGIGCPLFANDDIIIPKLIEFGYEEEDAYDYGTAACWEPYIIGKSFDQNNIKSIVFIKPFEELLENENLESIKDEKELEKIYNQYLEKYLVDFIKNVENMKWEKDTILSIFMDDCIKNNIDISKGGAKYNNYGFTGVGLSNTVNSILNIKKLVFDDKRYTLQELNKIRKNNFAGNDDVLKSLKNQNEKYGIDNDEIINLTNRIIRYATTILEKYRNSLGGKYKFGLSAPSYIDEAKDFPASLDGRKVGEPFGVHISSDKGNAYTQLIQFSSKLDYGENRFNGNVVDFFVTPNFISDNFDKFVDFLGLSIKTGFFEMQMNVVSSKTLIDAKENPEKFPNLIVRVWGFSAYFKDLPEEYKEYLIQRALQNEGKC